MLRKVTFLIMVFIAVDPGVYGSQDVVMTMSINYAKALQSCRNEALKSLYEGSSACIRINGAYTDWFDISMVARQGCVASPWLFNLFMDSCLSDLKLNLPESVKDDFKNFWRQDFEVTSRDTGCAFHCLSTKLDLLDPDGSLHHGNAEEFVKKHGADDVVAKQLLDIIHKCEDENPDSDMCLKTMKLANCFKVEVYKIDWVPDLDIIMAEIVAEA